MKRFFKVFLKIMFFLLLIGIAITLILIGVHYMKISKKEYIFSSVIDEVSEKVEEYLYISDDYNLGDNFQVDGTLKINLVSEEYANKAKSDEKYRKKNLMLNNLSKANTTYKIQHDKKNRKVFGLLDSKIGNDELFYGKYYITDSTEYFFVNHILNNYINDGNNNYFETYVEDVKTTDNINYLYHFIRDSIKNNITDDDLTGYDVETVYGDGTVDALEISYRIDDKSFKKLLKGVLKDLKSDNRANQILSLIYPRVNDLKVNEKKRYIKSNENYTINVYVNKRHYKPLKYELVYLKDDNKQIYTYEGDKNSGTLYYTENNEVKYEASFKADKKKVDISVLDISKNEVGTIKLEKDNNSLMFNLTLDLESKKYDISYTMKNKDLENNSYSREDYLNFKVLDDKITKIQGVIQFDSKISSEVKIDEDIDSSVIRSSLSKEEDEAIKNVYDTIKERLEK